MKLSSCDWLHGMEWMLEPMQHWGLGRESKSVVGPQCFSCAPVTWSRARVASRCVRVDVT